MNIKKISFAVIAGLALASSTTLLADGHPSTEKSKMATIQGQSPLDKITLSDDQKVSIQVIKDRYQPQLDALHSSKMSLKDQHAALDTSSPDYAEQAQLLESQIQQISQEKATLKKQMQEETKQVLTPDQRLLIEEMPKPVQ